MPDAQRFKGRVALVTGAAHGIGRAIGQVFVERGAAVWGCDVLEEPLTESVRQWRAAGGVAESRVVDVTDAAAVKALVAEVTARHGGTDILVHSAGGVQGQVAQPVEQVSLDDWRRIVAVNLDGAFLLVRAVAPSMKARGWGRIITISSGAGRSYSQTGIQAYASAKAGEIGFTRQIARDSEPLASRPTRWRPGLCSPTHHRSASGRPWAHPARRRSSTTWPSSGSGSPKISPPRCSSSHPTEPRT